MHDLHNSKRLFIVAICWSSRPVAKPGITVGGKVLKGYAPFSTWPLWVAFVRLQPQECINLKLSSMRYQFAQWQDLQLQTKSI